jgi:glycine betaine transporter
MAVYIASAITGLTRGIQWLSTLNVVLGLLLMTYVVIMGPTAFIADQYLQSVGVYMTEFVGMATFRADAVWLESWTVFFWGWFIGYGPMMAIFIARISKGRTIRELIMLLSVGAPVVTTVWFTIIGGAGIGFEIENPGSIATAFEGFNLPGALLAITQQLPNGFVVSLLFLILTTVFVATTGDSMTYSIAMAMTGHEHPSTALRVFWGLMMGIVAMILVMIGAGGISALQNFIVITGVPVSLLLLTSLWVAPKMVKSMRLQDSPR